VARVISDLKAITQAMEMYYIDHNSYINESESYISIRGFTAPTSDAGLYFLLEPVSYLPSIPLDPFEDKYAEASGTTGIDMYEVAVAPADPNPIKKFYNINSRGPDKDEDMGARTALIEILILQAIVLQAQGETEGALTVLERALTLAEPEGYVRSFIDQGEPMGRLLQRAATRGIVPDYVRMLLAALESETADQRRSQVTKSTSPSALIEPLTERELQVLRLLTTRLTSTEIAEQLFLSPNTVRSHMKSIYGKLDVHSRQEALERASELGLL